MRGCKRTRLLDRQTAGEQTRADAPIVQRVASIDFRHLFSGLWVLSPRRVTDGETSVRMVALGIGASALKVDIGGAPRRAKLGKETMRKRVYSTRGRRAGLIVALGVLAVAIAGG